MTLLVRLSKGCAALLLGLASGLVWAQPSASPIWLMGEVHDHPSGHFYRFNDLQSMLGGAWRPALLMEQFDTQRQADLTRAWQTCSQAACVIAAAGGKGWDWPLYEPLIDLALKYRLPLVAANLSRDQLMGVMKQGFGAQFDDATIERFHLNRPLPQPWLDRQRQAIAVGHCNLLPASQVDPMVRAQAARDIEFARLIEQYAGQGVVLIAGNGHVRRDLGVYAWLPQDLRSRVTIAGYVEPDGLDFTSYDRLRLLEPHPRPDPCEVFRRSRRQ